MTASVTFAVPQSERDFRQAVLNLAAMTGWMAYFTWRSDHSPAGFPDLVLMRVDDKRVLFAELKSEKGKTTPAQAAWIAGLQICGREVYLWKPSDWETVVQVLSRAS